MAELNFGLLTPPGSQSIGNAFVTGMDQAAAARAQENQNALSQYTLAKAKREDQLTNQMLAGMQGATTIEQQADVLRRGGRYKEANELLTSGLDRQIKLGTLNAQPGANAFTAARTEDLITKAKVARAQLAYESLSRLSTNPNGASDEDIRAAISDAVQNQGLAMADATRTQTALLAAPMEKRAQILALMAGTASDRLKALTPDIRQVTTPTGGVDFRNFAPFSQGFGQTPAGFTNLAPGMTQFQTGSLGVAQGNLNVNRGRAMDEGIAIPGGGAPVNAMPGVQPAAAPANAMIARPAAPATAPAAVAPATTGGYSPKMLREMAAKGMQPDGKGGQTFIPGGEKDPAVMLAEATAKAQIPKYDRDAGGFITPPTPSNPNGTFVPLTSVQTNKDVMGNLKALKMAGYDPVTGKDEISELIKQSTGGVIESAGAGLAGAVNYTTAGAEAIGRLETRANAISFALLNGKLGAGISNEDRKFIERQLGDVANPNTASGKRLAAWTEAKNRMLSLGMLGGATPPAGAAATPARGVDSSNPLLQ